MKKINFEDLPDDIKHSLSELGLKGSTYHKGLISKLEAIALQRESRLEVSKLVSVGVELSSISGTREECHSALDEIFDEVEARVNEGYKSPDFKTYSINITSSCYNASDEEIDVAFTCLESEEEHAERMARVSNALYILSRKDALGQLAGSLLQKESRKREFEEKLRRLKDEYGIE